MKKYIRFRIYKNIQLYPYIHLCMNKKGYTYVYEHIEISDSVRQFWFAELADIYLMPLSGYINNALR